LPVTVSVGGVETVVDVTITVNPAPAADGSFTPATGAQWWPSPRAFSGTTITWDPSGNATGYEVWLVVPGVPGVLSVQSGSRVLLCTATSTSCTVDRLVGPNSILELVATGNDGTRSTSVLPSYRSAEFTRVLNVMFAGNSSRLSSTAKAELNLLAYVIAAEGYSEVQVTSHISLNRATAFGRKLSQARADAVAKYLSDRVGREVTVIVVSEVNRRPVATNSTLAGRKANRRAEISVR
jgi:outer membrane protein OmpA-like peptidoglycan-associated protein